MPTYSVSVDGAEYSFDAPDDKAAGLYADDIYKSVTAGTAKPLEQAAAAPEIGGMFDEFGGSVGNEWIDRLKGLPAAMKEAFTGEQRQTEATRTTPDYRAAGGMPEMASVTMPSLKAAAGTLASGPEETARIIKSKFPNVQVFNDEKGNFFLKSAVDGKTYAIQPGFNAGDILRGIGTVGQYMIGGEVAGAAKGLKAGLQGAKTLEKAGMLERALGSAIGQTGIEASQAATGGTFDTATIPEAAAADIGIGLIGKGASALNKSLKSPTISGALESGGFGVAGGEGASIPASEVAGAAERMAKGESVTAAAPISQEQLITLVKIAGVKGNTQAKERLASLLDVDPTLLDYAKELGLDLPVDVLSRNRQLKGAIGLGRSQAASGEAAGWQQAVQDSMAKFDDIVESLGVKDDVAGISDKTRKTLTDAIQDLEGQAKPLYSEIEQVVTPESGVRASKLRSVLEESLAKKGGRVERLTPVERDLLKELDAGNVTWDFIKGEKMDLGESAFNPSSKFSAVVKAQKAKLYDAMKEDLRAAVADTGDAELLAKYDLAQSLHAKKMEFKDKILQGFGKTDEGTLIGAMNKVVRGLRSGDTKDLVRFNMVVPKEQQEEALLTAIFDATKAKSGEGVSQFGHAEYVKLFSDIAKRPNVAAKVSEVVGKEKFATMQKMYALSKAIQESRANVKGTGASLQWNKALEPTGIVEKSIDQLSAANIGKAVGGPGGALVGGTLGHFIGQSLAKAPPDKLGLVNAMFGSPEFKNLAIKAATQPRVSNTDVNKLIFSPAFRKFAKETGMDMSKKALTAWVTDSLQPKTKSDK